jgi:hypothetical protein
MMKLKMVGCGVAALGAALLVSNVANAATVYLAPEDSTNQIGFSGNSGVNGGGAYGVGNTITLAGPETLSTVDLFGYAGGGSLPIEIDLYSGSDPNTGTLIGSAEATPTGNGYTTEVFDFAGVVVPKTLTYIVSIVGNTGSYDDSFTNWQQFTGNTGAPTIGSSGDMWYGSSDSFVTDNSYAVDTGAKTNTLAAEFNAVPEPSTWAMMLIGLGGLGMAMRGRRAARDLSASPVPV